MSDLINRAAVRIEYHEERGYSALEQALRMRTYNLVKWVALAIATFSIALAFFHLFLAVFGTPESRSFRATHLTVMMILAIFLCPLGRGSWKEAPLGKGQWLGFGIDAVLIFLVIGIQIYTLWDVYAFMQREGQLITSDIWVGSILILLVLETTRRAVGLPMVIVASFFIIQTLYADYFFSFF